jgi:hypothetical protein
VAFIEVKPRKLSDDERESLFRRLKLDDRDEYFDAFVAKFESALGEYTELRSMYARRPLDSEARAACKEIETAAKRLQSAWNKAPTEALSQLDLAYQYQRYEDLNLPDNFGRTFSRSYTSAFSESTTPFFAHLKQSVETLVKTAERAATPTERQKKGGAPVNAPLVFLARAIASALIEILDIRPSQTSTGVFSEVLRLALQLVHQDSKPPGITSVVRNICKELSAISE